MVCVSLSVVEHEVDAVPTFIRLSRKTAGTLILSSLSKMMRVAFLVVVALMTRVLFLDGLTLSKPTRTWVLNFPLT